MKKIVTSGAEIEFRVNGFEDLHLSATPVIVDNDSAAVVLDRLGSQVNVSDATDEEVAAFQATLAPAMVAEAPAPEPVADPIVAADAPAPVADSGDQSTPVV